jgi:hypothetical protein
VSRIVVLIVVVGMVRLVSVVAKMRVLGKVGDR